MKALKNFEAAVKALAVARSDEFAAQRRYDMAAEAFSAATHELDEAKRKAALARDRRDKDFGFLVRSVELGEEYTKTDLHICDGCGVMVPADPCPNCDRRALVVADLRGSAPDVVA